MCPSFDHEIPLSLSPILFIWGWHLCFLLWRSSATVDRRNCYAECNSCWETGQQPPTVPSSISCSYNACQQTSVWSSLLLQTLPASTLSRPTRRPHHRGRAPSIAPISNDPPPEVEQLRAKVNHLAISKRQTPSLSIPHPTSLTITITF